MKTPKVILRYMEEFGERDEDVRQYILRQLTFFQEIPNKATTEAGWIALKLGCSTQQASTAIKWAMIPALGKNTESRATNQRNRRQTKE